MESIPDTQLVALIAFVVGILSSLLGMVIASCTIHQKPEPLRDIKHLFKKSSPLPLDNDNADDFQEYLAERLATSQAFRLKMIQGMARLHNNHLKVYSEVMRR